MIIILQYFQPLYFLLGQNIISNHLFSDTLSPCSSLKVRDQVSHTCKTDKILFFCSVSFAFLDSRKEDRRF
jgi:hypothetical protein